MIGAGMAGLTCAQRLRAEGFRVTVFEKSRGIGGRIASCRRVNGFAFDHGAQFVTARTPAFRALVDRLLSSGAGAFWRPLGRDGTAQGEEGWVVGVPAMNDMLRSLCDGIDIRLSTTVSTVIRSHDGWRLHVDASGSESVFDGVVCTAPAPQARVLIATERALAAQLAEVQIAPCWALMLSFAAPTGVSFDAARIEDGDLAWVARNSSKSGRGNGEESWVVHASDEWSRRNLEIEREDAAYRLTGLFADLTGGSLPDVRYVAAHRWRYALTTAPLGKPFLSSEDARLFIGGDWCLGPRVELAFESGLAMG